MGHGLWVMGYGHTSILEKSLTALTKHIILH